MVSYGSLRLPDVEQRYHSSELESLALLWTVHIFSPCLYGRYLTIVTDNSALTWLKTENDLTPKRARWAIFLQSSDVNVHKDADFYPIYVPSGDFEAPLRDVCYSTPRAEVRPGQDSEITHIARRLTSYSRHGAPNRL